MRYDKHTITIVRTIGRTRTADGVTTPITTNWTVRGFASIVSAREQFIGAQQGRTFSVAIQVPPDTDVKTVDTVAVSGTGDLALDGNYRITELRPDRHTTRLLCARYEVQTT